ncbi:MAG: hypothetical protein ACOY31_11005 [Bacillota bacterium]
MCNRMGKYADRIIIMAYDYGQKPEPVNLVTQAVEMAGKDVAPEKLIKRRLRVGICPESFLFSGWIVATSGSRAITGVFPMPGTQPERRPLSAKTANHGASPTVLELKWRLVV